MSLTASNTILKCQETAALDTLPFLFIDSSIYVCPASGYRVPKSYICKIMTKLLQL